jgi:hypothetical protein
MSSGRSDMGIGTGPGLAGSARGIGTGPGETGVTSGIGTGLSSAGHRGMHLLTRPGASVLLERSLCDFTSPPFNSPPSLAVAGRPTSRAMVIHAIARHTTRPVRLTIAPQLEPLYQE